MQYQIEKLVRQAALAETQDKTKEDMAQLKMSDLNHKPNISLLEAEQEEDQEESAQESSDE